MPKWVKVVGSAVINGAVTFGTSYLVLLNAMPADSTSAAITGVPLAIAATGAALSAAKDVQAYLTLPPAA